MKKRELTTRELADIMLGQSMNYNQMIEAIALKSPNAEMPISVLRIRVRSMVLSPHADITRRNGRKTQYTLNSISEDFFRFSDTQVKRNKSETRTKPARMPFDEKERAYCLRVSRINQLMSTVGMGS
ncbi:TPA: hypothetical protein PXM11_001842 [Yersinia enterocolitica]|uniref:hypothetical protein n=1 Tax=Yersinia intermedia TaxID=631 RepID=UPI0005E7ED43|nr:hypothetical protein [Yersinia intermedia]HDL6967547.1 hypothetical protein [Yersinia enterocolitica]CNH56464.1 Uncharacterised protein [Yersinia intermedia]HDL6971059.1 hypothetical protein [Yersinia enterocolitica]HDL6975812.1 hypothetical protein [Yersinia enterocolitica]HDL6987233.1 hypothetical protein [Yersinia enterocolitica]